MHLSGHIESTRNAPRVSNVGLITPMGTQFI